MLKIATPPDTLEEPLDDYSEALIITVAKNSADIKIRHKLKPIGGVLNGYLTTLLIQILKTTEAQNCNLTELDYDYPYHDPEDTD